MGLLSSQSSKNAFLLINFISRNIISSFKQNQLNKFNTKLTMDITDFEGNLKYKLIVPTLYIINWILLVVGPIYIPVQYQIYCTVTVSLLIFKMCYVIYNMLVILKRTRDTFESSKPIPQSQHEELCIISNYIHCFIIPSYKQDPELLGETLKWIASHPKSQSNFMIMLAMEGHEQNSNLKAQSLQQKYASSFRIMEYTRHSMRINEQRGKASNVSWCAEHLEQVFVKYSINPNDVIITIIDADSWVPPLYIIKVQEYLNEQPHHKDNAIFVPPQIFTRNYMDVPIFTRVYDHSHSLAQLSNMRSCFNLIFPMSNYSLSFNLVKRISFWDTCQDAIGEDFHTTQKAFWKTGGDAFNVPIYVPFNQVNVQTGEGYVSDVMARFWQAERHAQGCADVAYNLKMVGKTKVRSFKAFLVIYYIAECFCLPAIMPWVGLSSFLQNFVTYYYLQHPAEMIPISTLVNLVNFNSLLSLVFWGSFQIFKRYTNRRLYNKTNESLWRLLQYILVLPIDIALITVPSFTIAAFRVLMKNRSYRVAEKKMTPK